MKEKKHKLNMLAWNDSDNVESSVDSIKRRDEKQATLVKMGTDKNNVEMWYEVKMVKWKKLSHDRNLWFKQPMVTRAELSPL